MDVLKFQYPAFLHGLWGVVLLVLFFVWVSKNKEKLLKQFGHLEMMRKMMPGFSKTRAAWKSALFIMGYIFLILALADPQIGTKLEEVKREGVDIVVALDVSLSMQAEDIAPNRLEKARHEIIKLIDILQGDRIGLVAFAGMAHVQCPLTLDYAAAKLFLRMMDTDLIPQPGTALATKLRILCPFPRMRRGRPLSNRTPARQSPRRPANGMHRPHLRGDPPSPGKTATPNPITDSPPLMQEL